MSSATGSGEQRDGAPGVTHESRHRVHGHHEHHDPTNLATTTTHHLSDFPDQTFLDRIGIPHVLRWGFLGVLVFMTGNGVESNFLTPHLTAMLGSTEATVAVIVGFYSLAVLVASYMSGTLSDLFGPRRVMLLGFVVWVVFEIGFMLALQTGNIWLTGVMYFFRGFGFPLFAFAFLVWVNITTPVERNGTAVGWFYVMFTGGLPTLGSVVAIVAIPAFGGGTGGETGAMWASIALVVLGFCIAWFGVKADNGTMRIAPAHETTGEVLTAGLRLAGRNKKILQGFLVRLINTAPEFGMFIILPAVITTDLGWGQSKWLTMTVCVYAGNILFNAMFGAIGDKFGWRQTVRWCGVFGSAIGLLLWWYVPHMVPAGSNWGFVVAVIAGMCFGIMLAGFVPMGAIMPALQPDHKGAAMAMYTTAAGGAYFLGSAVVAVVLNICSAIGVTGFAANSAVVWTFVGLYVCAFIMVNHLRVPEDEKGARKH